MTTWIYLVLAILLEVSGTISMKLSCGFSKLWPSFTMFICYGLSFASLTIVLKSLDLSIAYAVWSGLGTAIVALVGIVKFKEPVSTMKIISLAMIIAGVIGLRFSSFDQ